MRQTFRGFYSDESRIDEVLKSDSTRIIFDTNVLLNLYNYHDKTRENFFETLKKLEDKLWLPYHVVLEYQRRRVAVLRREKKKFHILKSTADSCLEQLGKVKDQALFKRIPEVKTITDEYREKLSPILEEYKEKIEELNKSQLAAPKNDPIRGVITDLFDGRVGDIPSKEWMEALVAEGETRFEAKVPPGYRDEKKDKAEIPEFTYAGLNYLNKLGDLIIWKQLIEMAQAEDDIKNIVFVTDDGKEDWWHLDQSSNKEKIGARAELREEICDKGNIEHFSMYDSAEFLKQAAEAVNVALDEASVDDVKSHIVLESVIALESLDLESIAERIRLAVDNESSFEGEATSLGISYEDQFRIRKRVKRLVHDPSVFEFLEEVQPKRLFDDSLAYARRRLLEDYFDYDLDNDDDDVLLDYIIDYVAQYRP
ncbi:PIN domain-containing protein [Halodesulfovibrio sp.]|jgi:predicted nucleic acid-binding protein|uniref:PIN-like domain-containing protein n=1 Tax=Halodesulfovibrio sp. TaxID=1912772 RepID=UPI0025E8DC2C|nr:PIN domain-containing protein [Halodesulfovibrio sp.]MCT4627503.1 PIN domain-containing protein [Halodesulfovibrio sp.]